MFSARDDCLLVFEKKTHARHITMREAFRVLGSQP
jgi:hypothetical protein